jgi:hypothetical protein
MTREQTFSRGDVPGRSVIEHGPSPRRWLPCVGNRRPVARAVLAASKGLDYNRALNDLDADPCRRTDAHGCGVSVSQIAVMVAGVARPVRDRRMTISRALLMPSRDTILTRYEDMEARGRTGCAYRCRMGPVPSRRGHPSAQQTRMAAILTTRVHPDRQRGTGAAADRSDVES